MKMRSLLFAALCSATAPLLAADGDPDPGFASGNLAINSIQGPLYQLGESGAALGEDGSIVVAGVTGVTNGSVAAHFAVARFLPNGAVDSGFGSSGFAQVDFSNGAADYPAYGNRIARAPGGKWLVAGRVGSSYDVGIARLLPNGALDQSYGNLGRNQLDPGTSQDVLADLQVDEAGRAWLLIDKVQDAIVRFDAAGQLDTSWNGSGQLNLPNNAAILSFARDTQGRILLGGATFTANEYPMIVRRLLPDGNLDTSFGTQGTASFTPDQRGYVKKILPLPDGRILAIGTSNLAAGASNVGRITVLCLLADGRLDTRYGNGGVSIVDFAGEERSAAVYDVMAALGADGKLVIGRPVVDPERAVRLVRLLANGQPDETFGVQGKRSVLTGAGYPLLTLGGVMLAPGRLILAGIYNGGAGRTHFAGAWLDGDGIFRNGF